MLGTALTPAPCMATEVSVGRVPGSAWGEFGVVHDHWQGEGALSPPSALAPWEGTSSSSKISLEAGERAVP